MIDWRSIAKHLSGLAPGKQQRLLSITLALDCWPDTPLSNDGLWTYWCQADQDLTMLGIGSSIAVAKAGENRFSEMGSAHHELCAGWEHCSEIDIQALAFIGFAFADDSDGPLPNTCLWVPELLIRKIRGETSITFSCETAHSDSALARWCSLWHNLKNVSRHRAASSYRIKHNPQEDAQFIARGHEAIETINSGKANKLVLSRSLQLESESPLEAVDLLDDLAARHTNCSTFGIARYGQIFVGASPETLLKVEGNQVTVDAVAGTAWRDASRALATEKNIREHDFVAYAVKNALEPLCIDLQTPTAPEILQLSALAHLRRRITASRRPATSAFDLIARLHPTPAVGGTPTPVAIDWLAQHGEQRGAWYTGGVGWIDAKGDCDIVVPLRCGLLSGNKATIYAGAGFVAGSDPEQELAETEAKFSTMLDALTRKNNLDRHELSAA